MQLYDVKELPVSRNREIKVSFCAVADNISDSVKRSLESIVNLAEEMGYPYELIISTHMSINFKSDRIKFINETFSTAGKGKQLAYLHSSGNYVIVFDSSTVYNLDASDVIHSFLEEREKKALVYSMIVISRDLIDKAGGWRDLNSCEDIDLLVRIAAEGAIVAFPAKRYYFLEYMAKKGDSISDRIFKFRDAIISCNFKFKDIRLLKPEPFYISYASFLFSKLSKIKPFKFKENNKIIVIENIMESLILKDYERYHTPASIPKLQISRKEVEYLEKRSYLWNKVNKSIKEIIDEVPD
jgi:hypothetical protein